MRMIGDTAVTRKRLSYTALALALAVRLLTWPHVDNMGCAVKDQVHRVDCRKNDPRSSRRDGDLCRLYDMAVCSHVFCPLPSSRFLLLYISLIAEALPSGLQLDVTQASWAKTVKCTLMCVVTAGPIQPWRSGIVQGGLYYKQMVSPKRLERPGLNLRSALDSSTMFHVHEQFRPINNTPQATVLDEYEFAFPPRGVKVRCSVSPSFL